MSNSPRMRKMPPRPPKILLPVPGQYYSPQTATGMGYVPTPYGQTPVPMTPVPLTPVAGQPQMFYANRASEFVFTQFKGIKDFTKSGLSVGEKSAFWLYEKVSSWSKRWFTHIFLFVVILLYSIAGAMIFIAVEGTVEETAILNIRKKRYVQEQNVKFTSRLSRKDISIKSSSTHLFDVIKVKNKILNYSTHLIKNIVCKTLLKLRFKLITN